MGLNRKNLIIFLFLIISILQIFLVSADDIQSLGIFKQYSEVEIIQSCSNSTSLCDLCNITSIKYPNSSIIVPDTEMTKRLSDFNYTLLATRTDSVGKYLVNGFCQSGNEVKVWSYDFEVNVLGEEFSSAKALMYSFFLLLSILLFIGGVITTTKVNWGNIRSPDGFFIGVNDLKYIKVAMFFFSYLLLIFVVYLSWTISGAFLYMDLATVFLKVIFNILVISLFPALLIGLFITILSIIHDKKLNKLIKNNFQIR